MATTRNTGQIIEPWSGTGWPIGIFVDKDGLIEKNNYFCSRDECGRVNQRITREPWQLHCGHRLCKECYNLLQPLSEEERKCDACQREQEHYDVDARGRIVTDDFQMSRLPPYLAREMLKKRSPGQSSASTPLESMDGDDLASLVSYDAAPPNVSQITIQQPSVVEEQVESEGKVGFRDAIKDTAANREVNRFKVNCPYHCDTPDKLTIRTLEKHMISCKERLVACEKCTNVIKFSAKSEHATNSCPFRIVNCPNECGKRGIRGQDLPQHMAECEKKPPTCNICRKPYAQGEDLHSHLMNCVIQECPLGCGMISGEKLAEHLDKPDLIGHHLTSMMSLLRDADDTLKNETRNLNSGISQPQLSSIFDRLMKLETKSGTTERSLQHMAECEKKPPTCNICRKPYAQGEDLHSHLMNCVTQECPLGCGMTGEVKLFDHLSDSLHAEVHLRGMLELYPQLKCIMVQLANVEPKIAEGESSNEKAIAGVVALSKLLEEDVRKLTSYQAAFLRLIEEIAKKEAETAKSVNRLEILSNIRVAEMLDQKTTMSHIQMTSYNGRLIWKIENVQRRRNESQTRHSIYSHPFYTEVYGYKMCARIYFNGDGNGKNTHISLFFVVMKGEYDALLPWPFQKKVTMKLRNQEARPDIVEELRPEPDSPSFQRPVNEMNIQSGFHQFAEQTVVFAPESGFVVEDTMFVEILVDNRHDALHVSSQELNAICVSATDD